MKPPRIRVPKEGLNLKEFLEDIERDILEQSLFMTNGHQTEAAELLDLDRSTFRAKLRKYRLQLTRKNAGFDRRP